MKLEDTFAEHPKIELAGDQAAWLYVSGLLYAYRADTDGFVPAAKVPKLTGLRSPLKLAARLVGAGLWEAVEDGYVIHDYLEHQQSSAQREEVRESNAERLRRHRMKRKGNSDVTAFQNRSQRKGNGDVTTPEGEGENYTTTSVSDNPSSVAPYETSVVIEDSTSLGEAA